MPVSDLIDAYGKVRLAYFEAGLVAALFWALLANGLVATQMVEDGTLSSLIVRLSLLLMPTVILCTQITPFSPLASSRSLSLQ